MNVHKKLSRRAPGIAVVNKHVPQHGWLQLDLERTLGGVSRPYRWPVGSLQGQIRLGSSALGGAQDWRATASPSGSRAAPAEDAARMPAVGAERPATRPRRIPESDIIFVGRRAQTIRRVPETIASEPQQPALHSAPVPKVRSGVRPWLAVVMALATVGLSFYHGTQWSRCHVIVLPTTMNDKTAII